MEHEILVINDNLELLYFVADTLIETGKQVRTINDPQEALTYIETHQPALVISDLHASQGHSLDLLQASKELPNNVHYIFISAATEELEKKIGSSENISLLSKPLDDQELVNLIQKKFQEIPVTIRG